MSPLAQIERTLSAEALLAAENAGFLEAMGIVTVHLQASSGAGKTCLIRRTVESLSQKARIAVIQGTLSHTSPRISETGDLPVVMVNTGGQAYIDASLLRDALEQLPLADVDLLLIEEIGSLICRPPHMLEQSLRVVLASLPEGEDCPLRYPVPFAQADAVVLNKLDLLPHLEFDRNRFQQAVRRLNERAPLFELSCRTGEGLEAWGQWLLQQIGQRQGQFVH
ncbi:MAG: hydrogenase nickel incorporation protein HypB [Chloroflexia bacterium]|nr:hydrogenase nickel incorporation protein HypB [Chloroflexia bacterium]